MTTAYILSIISIKLLADKALHFLFRLYKYLVQIKWKNITDFVPRKFECFSLIYFGNIFPIVINVHLPLHIRSTKNDSTDHCQFRMVLVFPVWHSVVP